MGNQHTEKEYFKRYCVKCEKRYRPSGKYQRLCEPCQKIIRTANRKKQIDNHKQKKLKRIDSCKSDVS